MRYILFAVAFLIVSSTSAQTKVKDQKAFLKALNKLIANTTSQHWAHETPFTIDSAFHIVGDTLSATFQYTDSFTYRIRYAAPIDKINRIDHDVYLILIVPPKLVNMYENIEDKGWVWFDRRTMFHIGAVDSYDEKQSKIKEEILAAFERLQRWQ